MIIRKLIRTFVRLLSNARVRYVFTPLERRLVKAHRARLSLEAASRSAPLAVVQVVEDVFYSSLFAEIVTALRGHGPVRVEQFVGRSLRVGASQSFAGLLTTLINWNLLSDWKWIRFYSSFCDRIAYRATAIRSPLREIRDFLTARKILRKIRSVDQLVELAARGILIGDLIVDSYLRFKPCAAVDLTDPYLLVVVRQALKDIDLAFAYFGTKRPALYLTSYSTYVQHGIPARVAAKLGTKVLSFSTYQNFYKQITLDHMSQEVVHQNYCADFEKLGEQDEKRQQAAGHLTARLTGRVLDAQMGPMLVSAHSVKTNDVPDVKGAVGIFLHDFYDSPHIFAWMVFPDFWEWVCFTIDALTDAGIPFFLKPHPNQLSISTVEVDNLRKKYPNLHFLSPQITNRQLVEAGIKCAVSVYGSVVSEMAFMGVPSITCGDNPHVSFGFGRPARTREEFRARLLAIPDLRPDPHEMKSQACAFYYMHNLSLDPENTALRDKLVANWRIHLGGPENMEQTAMAFRELPETPGFAPFITALYSEIQAAAVTGPAQ